MNDTHINDNENHYGEANWWLSNPLPCLQVQSCKHDAYRRILTYLHDVNHWSYDDYIMFTEYCRLMSYDNNHMIILRKMLAVKFKNGKPVDLKYRSIISESYDVYDFIRLFIINLNPMFMSLFKKYGNSAFSDLIAYYSLNDSKTNVVLYNDFSKFYKELSYVNNNVITRIIPFDIRERIRSFQLLRSEIATVYYEIMLAYLKTLFNINDTDELYDYIRVNYDYDYNHTVINRYDTDVIGSFLYNFNRSSRIFNNSETEKNTLEKLNYFKNNMEIVVQKPTEDDVNMMAEFLCDNKNSFSINSCENVLIECIVDNFIEINNRFTMNDIMRIMRCNDMFDSIMNELTRMDYSALTYIIVIENDKNRQINAIRDGMRLIIEGYPFEYAVEVIKTELLHFTIKTSEDNSSHITWPELIDYFNHSEITGANY